MLKWFAFGHLTENLKNVSRSFSHLAHWMVNELPPGPEATVAMRKLLEAKDAAVRAALDPSTKQESVIDEVLRKVEKEDKISDLTGE